MARTKNTVPNHEAEVARIMEALRNNHPTPVASPVKSFFADRIVDSTAGSGVFLGRMKAAVQSASDTYNDGYKLERERQIRLRAERILRAEQILRDELIRVTGSS